MLDMNWIEDRLRRGGTLNGLNLPEEQLLRAHARAQGCSAQALIARWATEGPVASASTGAAHGRHSAAIPAHGKTSLRLDDLDFWADEPSDDDDDDDRPGMPLDDGEVGITEEQKICRACQGKGRQADGSRCSRCNGSGRVPVGPDDDEDDEDEEAMSFYGRIEDEE